MPRQDLDARVFDSMHAVLESEATRSTFAKHLRDIRRAERIREVRPMSKIPIDDYLAICDTKARYCRCLDEKDWDGYADTFTADVILDTTGSGGVETRGRERLLQTVRASIEDAITVHQVHSPEMTLVGADTIDVVWAMQDRVIWRAARAQAVGKRGLTGFGHYRERYVRCDDGRWRIAHSKLTRLHIDFETEGGAE